MRMTESRLRRIIRSVISENMPYDNPDEYIGYGAYGEVEDSDVSLEELEKMLYSHSFEAERADGYEEVMQAQEAYNLAKRKYESSRDEYIAVLKPFINDVIEIHGRSRF